MERDLDPDASARSLVAAPVEALRYDWDFDETPHEVPAIMREWMPEGVRVLDVGCATGALTSVVNRGKGNQVLGVEPDASRARAANAHDIEVVCGVLDDELCRSRGPFDVIVLADVLEHVPAPADLLDLAHEALRPAGLILVSVPNVAHWTVRAKLLLGRFDYAPSGIMDATHLRWFTH